MESKQIVTIVVVALLVIVLLILIVMGYNNIVNRNIKQSGYANAKKWWGTTHPSDAGTDTGAASS